jgi:hypothetical protein
MRGPRISLISFAMIVSACGKPSDQAEIPAHHAANHVSLPPALDHTSPDRAIASYWEFRDSAASVTLRENDTTSAEYKRWRPWRLQWRDVYTGVAAQEQKPKPPVLATYDRRIIDVELQSPTRAVVLAVIRNTTPIPSQAIASEYDVTRRRDGDTIRYILEKDTTGWRIGQVQRRYYSGDSKWHDVFDGVPLVPTEASP